MGKDSWRERIAAAFVEEVRAALAIDAPADKIWYVGLALKGYDEAVDAGQPAKDAQLPAGALEAAFREGYDFGQADAGWKVVDADDAWRKSGTGQPAKDAIPPAPPAREATREIGIRICNDCYEMKGEMCHEPECVFCRRTMAEVGDALDMLLIRPVVDGERLDLHPLPPAPEGSPRMEPR